MGRQDAGRCAGAPAASACTPQSTGASNADRKLEEARAEGVGSATSRTGIAIDRGGDGQGTQGRHATASARARYEGPQAIESHEARGRPQVEEADV